MYYFHKETICFIYVHFPMTHHVRPTVGMLVGWLVRLSVGWFVGWLVGLA